MTHQFYNDNATELAQKYLSQSFDVVNQSWSQLILSVIKNANALSLDLGTGSGRVAKFCTIGCTETMKRLEIY
jgi:hypothetical protein